MNRLLIAACAAAFSAGSLAASVPQPLVYDQRVREVAYNPEDIVTIHAAYGISTHILFAADETITHTILGDSLAWETTPVGNNLFIKPIELKADTNLSVVTNRHVYQFDLKTVPKSTEKVFFKVQIVYPDQDAARRLAAIRLAETTQQLAETRAQIERIQAEQIAKLDNAMHDAEFPLRRSVNYWLKGSPEVQPDEAYDDGTFTYFRFKGNREFPTVYLVNDQGDESLVNTTVKGDTILVQRIARNYMLRKDKDVAQVTNPNYDRVGIANETGTITPSVTREVRGEIDPLPQTLPTRQPTTKTVGVRAAPTRIEPTKTIPGAPPAFPAPAPALAAPSVEIAPSAPPAAPVELLPEPATVSQAPAMPEPPAALVQLAPAAPTPIPAPVIAVAPVATPREIAPPPPVAVVTAPATAQPLPRAIAERVAARARIPVPIRPADPVTAATRPRTPTVALVPRQQPTLPASLDAAGENVEYQPMRAIRRGNLRAAPSAQSAKIGSVLNGAVYNAIGRDRQSHWFAVEHEGQKGWVHASLVKLYGSVSRLPIYKTDAIERNTEKHTVTATEHNR